MAVSYGAAMVLHVNDTRLIEPTFDLLVNCSR